MDTLCDGDRFRLRFPRLRLPDAMRAGPAALQRSRFMAERRRGSRTDSWARIFRGGKTEQDGRIGQTAPEGQARASSNVQVPADRKAIETAHALKGAVDEWCKEKTEATVTSPEHGKRTILIRSRRLTAPQQTGIFGLSRRASLVIPPMKTEGGGVTAGGLPVGIAA